MNSKVIKGTGFRDRLRPAPEKIEERFSRTIVRVAVTTTIITSFLVWSNIVRDARMHSLAAFEVVWIMVFSIVFGGHWLEVLFINYIKFQMTGANLPVLYFTRMLYWYVSAVPLFFLAGWVRYVMTDRPLHVDGWYLFGFFYIGVELFMQGIIHFRRKKSFYSGAY